MNEPLLHFGRKKAWILVQLSLLLTLLLSSCGDRQPKLPIELSKAREALQSITVKAGTANILTQLDSIEAIGRQYKDDSLTIATELKKAEFYLSLFEIAPADSLLKKVQTQTIPHPALTFALYSNLSVAELIRDDIPKAISYQRQATSFAEKHIDEIDQGLLTSLYINTAMSYSYTDKADSMRYFLSQGYELAEARGDSARLSHCYAQEAAIYSNALDDDKCAEYLSRAIEISGNISSQAPNKNIYRLNLGQTLYNALEAKGVTQSRIDSIEGIIKEMITSEEQGLKRDYILGHGHKILGYLYTASKRYTLAETHLLKADILTDDATIGTEIDKIKLLIKVEGGDKAYQEEINKLEASLQKKLVSPMALLEGYRVVRRAYETAGNPHEALRINDSIDKYLDSLRAENKYREAMKLERGRALKEANAQIKNEQTSKQKLLWWLIGIGTTATIIVIVLYTYNKQKSRRLVEKGELLQEALQKSKEEQERVVNELERIKEKIRTSTPEEERQATIGEERELRISAEMQENITQALQLLMQEQHLYRDKNLTLESLSNTIGINRSYMSIYLNRIVGCNFYEYVAKLRLEEAKELLCDTDYTLQVIANETGFSTMQTFHNVFKKYNDGQTPTEYRNRCAQCEAPAH